MDNTSLVEQYIKSGYTKERIVSTIESLENDEEMKDYYEKEINDLNNGEYDSLYTECFGKRLREEEHRKNTYELLLKMEKGEEINWKDEYTKDCNSNLSSTLFASSVEMKKIYENKLETGKFNEEKEIYENELNSFEKEKSLFFENASDAEKCIAALIIDSVNEQVGDRRRMDWDEEFDTYKALGGEEYQSSSQLSRAIYTNKLEFNEKELSQDEEIELG